MQFSFLSPAKIIVGEGEALTIYKYIPSGIKRILIIHGTSLTKRSVFRAIKSQFIDEKIVTYQTESGEPSPKSVDKAATFAINENVQAIIGIGGGSVMDTAKAVAALVPNGDPVIDYLEGVGIGKKVAKARLPLILLPTTTGTGTEVTKNAVISSHEQGFKKSMRDDSMIADVAVIDPLLTEGMPRSVLASSGMDAICQLIESYTTKNANPMTDALALHHAGLAVAAIEDAFNTDSASARTTLGVCALVSGLTLANAGLGIAHGLASGVGAFTDIPHGIACGIMLPYAMRFNIDRGVVKYAALGEIFTDKQFDTQAEACEAAVSYIIAINEALGIPQDLKAYHLTEKDIKNIAESSMGSSMSKNPVPVSLEDCIHFLNQLV